MGRTFGRAWEGVVFPPNWELVPSLWGTLTLVLCSGTEPFSQLPWADAALPFLLSGLVWFGLWCAFVPQAGPALLLIKVREDIFYPLRLCFILSSLRHCKAFGTLSWWTLSSSNEGTGQGVSRAESPWSLVGQALNQSREWFFFRLKLGYMGVFYE